ncbi:MAG: hypothetical protein M1398_08340 [Deltaproteobacteria bacterium]|nr:hypothetical protein [Deltaproteobacteria bacterium]
MDEGTDGSLAAAPPGKICPACKDGYLKRIERKKKTSRGHWLKRYSCSKCKTRYLRVFDLFEFRVQNSGWTSRNRKRDFAIAAIAIVVALYLCYSIVIDLY